MPNLFTKAKRSLKGLFDKFFYQPPQKLVSPVPDTTPTPTKTQMQALPESEVIGKTFDFKGNIITPTPTPQSPYRNPNIDLWKKQRGNRYNELVSATGQASKEFGVPQDLLMDISGLESEIGIRKRAMDRNSTAAGPFMFINQTAKEQGLKDKQNATESARLAAKLIKKKKLRWWDVYQNKGAAGNRLTDFYKPEELAPFLD